MKSIPGNLVAAIFAVVMLAAFTFIPPKAEIGKVVPNFTLKGIDGKTHSIADYKGKIVVLEWTNPNCPFVQRVYRDKIMTNVQKKFADKVVWLAVNSTNPNNGDFETAESLSKTYREWDAVFSTMLLDPDGSVGKMFDAKTTPHMYVIDKEGKLVYAGGIDDDPRGGKSDAINYVDAALEDMMNGKQVAVATSKPYGCSVKY